jgi:hypothetical protein
VTFPKGSIGAVLGSHCSPSTAFLAPCTSRLADAKLALSKSSGSKPSHFSRILFSTLEASSTGAIVADLQDIDNASRTLDLVVSLMLIEMAECGSFDKHRHVRDRGGLHSSYLSPATPLIIFQCGSVASCGDDATPPSCFQAMGTAAHFRPWDMFITHRSRFDRVSIRSRLLNGRLQGPRKLVWE